ncbi:MAG TPA: hypothetical protein VMU73_00850 [Gaiellaceae bacterium]|nr:hypothetical protein [Gaiellaceae bacterium]
MERNRIAFLVTCFALRTLLVLAPLLLATELVMVVLAARQGWLRDKLAGWVWLVRNSRRLFARRRQTQRLRIVRDRELARYLSAVVDPGMVALPALVRILNPLVVAYWAVARRTL